MMKSIISVAGIFAAAASAYTPPNGPNPTYGSLLTPNGDVPVVTGQTIDITWTPKQPAAGVTVSLVLCNGPSTNCVRQSSAIVEGVPAGNAKYSWNVPCDLPLGQANTATGYGMLIIVDGTGEYQYSTQFSVNKGASCGTTTTSTSSSSSISTSSTSSRSSSSSSSSPSASSSVTYTDKNSSWLQWSGVPTSSTTLSRSTTAAPVVVTTSAAPTPAPATATATQAATTSARPSVYTGAAAMPSAFVNVFAAVGAAGLAVFAL